MAQAPTSEAHPASPPVDTASADEPGDWPALKLALLGLAVLASFFTFIYFVTP